MKPVCMYAIFARSSNPPDLIGAHAMIKFKEKAPDDPVLSLHAGKLFVCVLADPGGHELRVAHEGSGWNVPMLFTIESEDSPTARVLIESEFPVFCRSTLVVNRYPLLLDGEPFGEALLATRPVTPG